jgi:hypothetical protein
MSRVVESARENESVHGLTLFDDFERTDPTPARNLEGSFHFLNRITTVVV